MEERIEGILSQMDKRLNHLETEISGLRNEIRNEISGLRNEIARNFRWTIGIMLGILIPMWVSIILTVIFKT